MSADTPVTHLPCPFCGPGELQTFRLGSLCFVQCPRCEAEQTGRTEVAAAEAWNTRYQIRQAESKAQSFNACPNVNCNSDEYDVVFSTWSKAWHCKCISCKAEGALYLSESEAIESWRAREALAQSGDA